jgi:flagellar basal body-associated protein FliL
MIILLVILVVTFIFILGAGLAFIRMFSTKKTVSESKPGDSLLPAEESEIKTGIRWSYFILPAVMLIVTLGIVGYF